MATTMVPENMLPARSCKKSFWYLAAKSGRCDIGNPAKAMDSHPVCSRALFTHHIFDPGSMAAPTMDDPTAEDVGSR
eukprot:196714-Lingulodinium_polyedra.AAC.1